MKKSEFFRNIVPLIVVIVIAGVLSFISMDLKDTLANVIDLAVLCFCSPFCKRVGEKFRASEFFRGKRKSAIYLQIFGGLAAAGVSFLAAYFLNVEMWIRICVAITIFLEIMLLLGVFPLRHVNPECQKV